MLIVVVLLKTVWVIDVVVRIMLGVRWELRRLIELTLINLVISVLCPWPVKNDVPVATPALLTVIILALINLVCIYNFNIRLNILVTVLLRCVWNCVTAVRLGRRPVDII